MDDRYSDLQDHYISEDEFKKKALLELSKKCEAAKKPSFDFVDFFIKDDSLEFLAVGGYDTDEIKFPKEIHGPEDLADNRFCLGAQPLYEEVAPRKSAPKKDKAKQKKWYQR